MLQLNINENKKIEFGVNVVGVDVRDLKGSLKLIIEDVEYGFPIKIYDGNVIAELPPLSDVIKKQLTEGEKFEARLEIIAGDTLMTPWVDTISIEVPIIIEAKVKNIESTSKITKPEIEIKNIEENSKKKLKEEVKIEKKKPSIFAKRLTGI